MNATCLILGAGSAGLFCAALLGEGGCPDTVVLDGNAGPGEKLLLSGSGQCNFTHEGTVDDLLCAYGGKDQERFLRKAIHAFSNEDVKKFFTDRGLPPLVREDGKVFPSSLRSRDIVEVLMTSARKGRVDFHFNEKVHSASRVDPEGETDASGRPGTASFSPFTVKTGKDTYKARFLVLATGGSSYPGTGSDGSGYYFAENLGHSIVPPRPALAPVVIRDFRLRELAGVSLENVQVSLRRGGKKVLDARGDLVFTHAGLSGPVILKLSRLIENGDLLTLNLSGAENPEDFLTAFPGMVRSSSAAPVKDFLKDLFSAAHPDSPGIPKRLRQAVLESAGLAGGEHCGNLSKSAVLSLAGQITAFPLVVEKTGGFSVAMATAGGVALSEVYSDRMESKLLPGLFFAGEVLDIDGDTGGYNIQAAFSTAFCVARTVLDRVRPE